MVMELTESFPSHKNNNTSSCRFPLLLARSRSRGRRRSYTGTAVVIVAALLVSTTAWLSLVFSSATAHRFHRFTKWDGSPRSTSTFPHITTDKPLFKNNKKAPSVPSVPLSFTRGRHTRLPSPGLNLNLSDSELGLTHIVFGIAGSSQLWKQRKEFVRLWWRPDNMRGHVWLEERVSDEDWDDSLPPIMISEDTSRFRYTNPTGHPSGLRIARIISESFRLGLPNVRWFVLGDDDTIFNVDNLVAVLSKYDPSEMVYVGGPSESHSANTYFSHSMAYGGGGIAISYPLADALSSILDKCLERYHKLYGSDDRLHACISELGLSLSREHGFHQWDIRGSAHGLLASHPIAPFVSIHHVEAVDPFYPGLTSLESLKLFTKAMKIDPISFLQRAICYDHSQHLSFSVSLGYVIQVFPTILHPHVIERSEKTYSAWNGISHRNEFDMDTRDPQRSICKRPILFFLKDVGRQGNCTLGSYARTRQKDYLKRRLFCFPRSPPLPFVKNIRVLGYPLRKNWHLAPRRPCCKLNQTNDELLTVSVEQCEQGSFGSFISLM
ncbi:hypothetical protein K2173_021618 [Erythroxylum novogranatense]|uniref:Uncharacterized protein n=1 Tax=Erythroxylum novogranatense TaxID=1862640 RepID=A0AAV8TR53_9ROSI|nr:hypothetical protein K2173_021618 [Erythroxylum novogranatense]